MTGRRILALVATTALIAVVGWWLWSSPAQAPSEPPEARSQAFPALPGVDGSRPPSSPSAERPSDEQARREVAEALREAIRRARDERLSAAEAQGSEAAPGRESGGAAPGAAATGQPAEAAGHIDPQYIRDAVQQLRPLLAECYELARDAAARDDRPVPEGRLITRFVFSGEPEVGGVVEESTILEESTLRDTVLEECFSETLFTLELPPPDEGGTITVHYPFELSDEPDEAE